MLAVEGCLAFNKVDLIPFQLVYDDLRFVGLNLSAAVHELVYRQILIMSRSVGLSMIESGKVKNRFTQRFAWNGTMVDADAANAARTIDDRHSFCRA